MTSKTKPHPMPLADTLRDLALLRASDCDLGAVLPPSTQSSAATNDKTAMSDKEHEVQEYVGKSYEFVREARAALRLLNSEAVDKQGARLEDVRSQLEDILGGLEGQ